MADEIKVNDSAVEENASNVQGAAFYFTANFLCPNDSKSTITANGAGKNSYASSQELISSLGEALEKEVSNIRSVGAEFNEYDSMVSSLWENGSRFPMFTSGN